MKSRFVRSCLLLLSIIILAGCPSTSVATPTPEPGIQYPLFIREFLTTDTVTIDGNDVGNYEVGDNLVVYSNTSTGTHIPIGMLRVIGKNPQTFSIFITQPILNTLNNQSHLSPCVIKFAKWQIIMLNSSVEYEVPGKFKPEELSFLQSALEQSKDCHVMVCLHHHPVPMGCKWLDTQVVRNAVDFWQVIDQFSHIKAIVWGHVHQESDRMRNSVRLLSAPSTCVQFKPLSSDFAVDEDVSPGYRWFDLYDNGDIETQVSRVEGVKFVVDWTVKGY